MVGIERYGGKHGYAMWEKYLWSNDPSKLRKNIFRNFETYKLIMEYISFSIFVVQE